MDLKEKPFKFVVRLPMSLRNKIAETSQQQRRSMNSEIVARLEKTFSGTADEEYHEVRDEQDNQVIHPDLAALFGYTRDDDEERLLAIYRRLTPAQRAALLELLT